MVKVWLGIILSFTMVACSTNPSMDSTPPGSSPPEVPSDSNKKNAGNSEKIVKSPHGYVINGPKSRFGGFIGNCSSDENFKDYWQCQSENGGESLN
jgi:hypothetical protein